MVALIGGRWRAGDDWQLRGRRMMCALLREHNSLILVVVIVRGRPLCRRLLQLVYCGFHRQPLRVRVWLLIQVGPRRGYEW